MSIYTDVIKLQKVYYSCKTKSHYQSFLNYLNFFKKKHSNYREIAFIRYFIYNVDTELDNMSIT
jgi:hypothetical protein